MIIFGRYFNNSNTFQVDLDFENTTEETEGVNIWPSIFLEKQITELVEMVPSNSSWILCPLYDGDAIIEWRKRNGEERDEKDDFQIGITGTGAEGELPLQTMNRELGEEVGLIGVTESNFIKEFRDKRGRDIYMYLVNIQDVVNVPNMDNNRKIKTGEDNRRKKVACVVYGSFEKMKEYIDSSINRYKDEDNIIGLIMIQKRNFSNIKNKIIPDTSIRVSEREQIRGNIRLLIKSPSFKLLRYGDMYNDEDLLYIAQKILPLFRENKQLRRKDNDEEKVKRLERRNRERLKSEEKEEMRIN